MKPSSATFVYRSLIPMKFGKIMIALAMVASLTLPLSAQEKTEKKAKKTVEAVAEKKAAVADEKKTAAKKKSAEKTAEVKDAVAQKTAPAEKKVEAAEKKAATEKKTVAAKKGAAYTGGMVNINTASKTALMALPGVGEANADHIIKGRPYKSADELISRKIVQPHYYDDFKQYITTK